MWPIKALGCCLFASTDSVENVPREAQWLFSDATKAMSKDGAIEFKCTFISPITDKVRFQ